MAWFVALVQDANASHANPYACAGSDNAKSSLRYTRKSLHLYKLPTIQKTPNAVQAPDNSHANPYTCEGSQHFNSFLTPVQASDNSHANPYACEGCQKC
ncbi:hypothetical protein O181_090448 [Austropuccinia psidii MF-1]|uniref:Uncharacterized protein n=1 Tax=Austropuccinia psidii MF-1 TaxID=1389203 RepID=A0A9Q3IV28_9BASI|nr:hypothetical protein [Austropuccinia psidii MF-1]